MARAVKTVRLESTLVAVFTLVRAQKTRVSMESSTSRERTRAQKTPAAENAITEVADLLTSDSCRLALRRQRPRLPI